MFLGKAGGYMAAKKTEPRLIKMVKEYPKDQVVELGHVPPPRTKAQAAAAAVPPPKKKK
jgi:hypothetical protein